MQKKTKRFQAKNEIFFQKHLKQLNKRLRKKSPINKFISKLKLDFKRNSVNPKRSDSQNKWYSNPKLN